MKQRICAVDFMKCLAILFILNAHAKELYGSYSSIATGGVLGNSIFFFCSGFTLMYGKMQDFPNWYKKRVNRIIPSVFSWALISAVIGFGNMQSFNIFMLIKGGGLWFLSCILIYYIIFYFICRYLMAKLKWVLSISLICLFIYYFYAHFDDNEYCFKIYAVKNLAYFPFMLLGALCYMNYENFKKLLLKCKIFTLGVLLFFVLVCWFSCCLLPSKVRIFQEFPLLAVSLSMFAFFNALEMKYDVSKWKIYLIANFVASITLQIYIVQDDLMWMPVITEKLFLLPILLRLLIMITTILGAAIILHVVSQFWINTFSNEKYDWKCMVGGMFKGIIFVK